MIHYGVTIVAPDNLIIIFKNLGSNQEVDRLVKNFLADELFIVDSKDNKLVSKLVHDHFDGVSFEVFALRIFRLSRILLFFIIFNVHIVSLSSRPTSPKNLVRLKA